MPLHPRRMALRESGFTLIELSVAILITLFLTAGLFAMQQSTRKASAQQTLLAQLQDNERLAMTIMTDVIQAAGFFAEPTIYQATTALPDASAAGFAAGQGIYGVTSGGSDQVYVQYLSEGHIFDNMILCNGQQAPDTATGAGIAYINQFYVDAANHLVCNVSTNVAGTIAQITVPPVELVDNVQNLSIVYGVATTGANGNSVDTYMTATQVTAAAMWSNVSSVKIRVTFTNPLYQPANQPTPTPGQPATVVFERVIGVMGKMGNNT